MALKPAVYYDIVGAQAQATHGDVAIPCPDWNDVGAVDYLGKALWNGHDQYKGNTAEQARAIYCQKFSEALANKAKNFF